MGENDIDTRSVSGLPMKYEANGGVEGAVERMARTIAEMSEVDVHSNRLRGRLVFISRLTVLPSV